MALDSYLFEKACYVPGGLASRTGQLLEQSKNVVLSRLSDEDREIGEMFR